MKPIVANIALAAIPSLLLLIYVYSRDKGSKEPPFLVLATFVLGFFAVIPALVVELLVSEYADRFTGLAYQLFRAFIIAALVEEGMKLAVIRIFLFRRKAFDEVSDGMLYTITASLGFAFFENILYSFGPTFALIVRGVTAVPLHAAASGVLGYYIGVTKRTGRNLLLVGLAWAVIIHGIYDFLLFTGSLFSLLVIPMLIVLALVIRMLFRRARRLDALDDARADETGSQT